MFHAANGLFIFAAWQLDVAAFEIFLGTMGQTWQNCALKKYGLGPYDSQEYAKRE